MCTPSGNSAKPIRLVQPALFYFRQKSVKKAHLDQNELQGIPWIRRRGTRQSRFVWFNLRYFISVRNLQKSKYKQAKHKVYHGYVIGKLDKASVLA